MPEKPDVKDIESLKKFFEEHEGYTNMELALRYRVTARTILNWKYKCGIETKKFKPRQEHKHEVFVPDEVVDESIWDNHDWLYEHYVVKGLGTPKIARIAGTYDKKIQRRLRRYGIERVGFGRCNNKCCNKEWLVKHYLKEKMTLMECAKLANVNIYTIYNWLLKFDIYPRGQHEASAVANRRKKFGTSLSRNKEETGKE
jgi:transposase